MADTPVQKRRLNENDWKLIAEYIADETQRRANNRSHLEKVWKEIDRQVRMEAVPKLDANGGPLKGKEWMSALELPLQAQALELLNADARRMIFATDRNFFSAHAAMKDEELRKLEEEVLVPGLDEFNEMAVEAANPGQKQRIEQDDLDALVEGALIHHHALYDFRGMWDVLNAEAFKYGTFAGRIRPVNLDKFTNDFRGVVRNTKKVPVLVPQSIRNTYLDDTFTATMHEGLMAAPSFIYSYWHVLDDLRLAAAKGSKDPTALNGGWMADRLDGLEPLAKDNKSVQLLEFEGDLLVPRSRGPSIFLPNVIVTVVVGKDGGKNRARVIRYREWEFPFRSYIAHPYHQEDAGSPYGVSPLMKGMPVQMAATEAFNRMTDAAVLNNEPPVAWSPQDYRLEATGGPVIEPGAQWDAMSKPEVMGPFGDPTALLSMYQSLLMHYAEVTGITAPRLGAQTKSHQTAFAIDTEQTRGVIRTVDYVRSMMYGPMNTFLSMEYEMVRRTMGEELIYLPKRQQYVEIAGKMLPERVSFDVHGAGGPAEEIQRDQKRFAALQQTLQVELTRRQAGEQGMDLEEIQRQMLEDGGWIDIDKFFAAAGGAVPGAAQGGTNVSSAAGIVGEEPIAALTRLAAAGG